MKETRQQRQWPLDQTVLGEIFDGEQGRVYRRVIDEARRRGLRFALGGGLAINAYTGMARNTKDLDVYLLPAERAAMIGVLTAAGMSDYYEQQPYDRGWIYRGHLNGTIVDVIWEMANHHAPVDEAWLTRGPELAIKEVRLRLLPPEELVWTKLHVLQRDRCDWPDILNLLYATGETIDWNHLLKRVAGDIGLLAGALSVFTWLCPGRARKFPPQLWERVGIAPPAPAPEIDHYHVGLIDSRPWFIPALTGAPPQ